MKYDYKETKTSLEASFALQRKSEAQNIDSRWTELKFVDSFSVRSYFASCIQAGLIYVHGGFNPEDKILQDMYSASFQESPMTWKKVIAQSACHPGALRSHTLVSYLSNLLIVGGQQSVIKSNPFIYRFNLMRQEWTKCQCRNNNNQIQHFSLDSHNAIVSSNYMYLLFGYNSQTASIDLKKINDNLLYSENICLKKSPSPRTNSSACLINETIYIFGGGEIQKTLDDFWTLDGINGDIEKIQWTEQGRSRGTPQSRKGHTLVAHEQSKCLFMFGGIRSITKEQNDIHVYSINHRKWVKIHFNTNNIYQASPTILRAQTAPKKTKSFRSTVRPNQTTSKMFQTTNAFLSTLQIIPTQIKPKMSIMRQKRYRAFINRKKKLLNSILINRNSSKEANKQKIPRCHSPMSEALIFSVQTLGQQRPQQEDRKPKMVYDEIKGQVLGRKPCARDGHAGLIYQSSLLILGGDRHRVSFNDAFLFDLNQGLQSLAVYENHP